MATETAGQLFLRNSYTFTISAALLGTGKTVTGKICATAKGDPSAIGSCSVTLTETGGNYVGTLGRSTILTDLASYVGTTVYVHVDDATAYHSRKPFLVVDGRSFDE